MNATAKKAFVEELRSGRWRQISGSLCDGKNGRCVAGVLCEAYKRIFNEGEMSVDQKLSRKAKRTIHVFVSDGQFLPVKAWAGLENKEDRSVLFEGHRIDLSVLADVGVPFTVLADIIEHQL